MLPSVSSPSPGSTSSRDTETLKKWHKLAHSCYYKETKGELRSLLCLTLEAFNLLRALMAEGGGICGQVCWERCLGDFHTTTSGMLQALTKENLSLLLVQGRRGPITSPLGGVICRESSLVLAHSAQHPEPPSHMTLRPACFVCSLPVPSPPPLSCRFTFATASPQYSAHTSCRIPAHSFKERVGESWMCPPLCILTMGTPAPLQCCRLKPPPGHDPLPVYRTVLDPIGGRGQRD